MDKSAGTGKSKKAEQIVLAAEELFQKFGFRKVAIEEICRKASVSKMTFYKYYPNKEELFKIMMNKWLSESEIKINELKQMNIPLSEKIRLMLGLKEEYLSKLSNEFMTDYINPEAGLQGFMHQFFERGLAFFIDFIKDAQLKGEVKKEIRPELIIAVLNKLKELTKDEKLMSLYPDIKEFSLEVNSFFFFGILTPKDNVREAKSA